MKNFLLLLRVGRFGPMAIMCLLFSSCSFMYPERKAVFIYQNGQSMETKCRDVESLGAGCWECDYMELCGVRRVCFPCQ